MDIVQLDSLMKQQTDARTGADTTITCNIEFFHIYTDETIGQSQEATLDCVREMMRGVDKYSLSILIDNYNPTEHTLDPEDVFAYVQSKGFDVDYWAYEADMLYNARLLLDKIMSRKLKKEYTSYIEKHGKYPCSLLTAAWYLTRLGYFKPQGVIRPLDSHEFTPVSTLINVLPESYKDVEGRCFKLIGHSEYADAVTHIHDIFLPVISHNKTSL